MRRVIISVFSFILLLLAGCGTSAGYIAAEPGKEFTLSVGQTASIKGESLKVTFLQVTEDSRCPTGVTCIWEGRATSLVRFVSNNTTELKLSEPGLTESPYQYTFGNYFITFHLLPYPEAGKQITADQYRLVMSINKP